MYSFTSSFIFMSSVKYNIMGIPLSFTTVIHMKLCVQGFFSMLMKWLTDEHFVFNRNSRWPFCQISGLKHVVSLEGQKRPWCPDSGRSFCKSSGNQYVVTNQKGEGNKRRCVPSLITTAAETKLLTRINIMVEGEGTEHKAQQLGMEAKSHNLLLINYHHCQGVRNPQILKNMGTLMEVFS